DHPPDAAQILTSGIRGETQAAITQSSIQLGEKNARLHADPPLRLVEFKDPGEASRIEDNARPDGGTGQRGPGGTGRHRDAELATDRQRPEYIILRPHHRDRARLDDARARVRCVSMAARLVHEDALLNEAGLERRPAGRVTHHGGAATRRTVAR